MFMDKFKSKIDRKVVKELSISIGKVIGKIAFRELIQMFFETFL